MVTLVVWALLAPFRVAALLGLRRTLVVGCVLVLGVTVHGVAEDAGLLATPTRPRPATGRTTQPSRAARADIPPGYLRLYQRAPARWCPGLPWGVLAAVGKAESDHGRARLPGVRSGANRAGAAGPMQLGIHGRAGRTWQRYRTDGNHDGRRSVYDPADAVPTAARYLCAHGAAQPGGLRRALYAYNHSAAYVARVLAVARRYQALAGGAR
jgi:hypothetical protein